MEYGFVKMMITRIKSELTQVNFRRDNLQPRVRSYRSEVKPEACGLRPAAGKGVTLVELIMVITIVGILAIATIPRFGSFYFLKISGAMKKVASDIRYIQQLALSRHANTRMEFNAAGNSYQSCYCDAAGDICSTGSCGSANWPAITDPFTRANLQVNFNSDPKYGGIDITTVNFGGTSALRFNWQGTPQDANGINLSGGDGTANFSYKGNANTISVTPNTGRVRIQ